MTTKHDMISNNKPGYNNNLNYNNNNTVTNNYYNKRTSIKSGCDIIVISLVLSLTTAYLNSKGTVDILISV